MPSTVRMSILQELKDACQNNNFASLINGSKKTDLDLWMKVNSYAEKEDRHVFHFPDPRLKKSSRKGLLKQEVSFEEVLKRSLPTGKLRKTLETSRCSISLPNVEVAMADIEKIRSSKKTAGRKF